MNVENKNDEWTPIQFYAWLIEEAYNFRKVYEGLYDETADETKTSKEWAETFQKWLEDKI